MAEYIWGIRKQSSSESGKEKKKKDGEGEATLEGAEPGPLSLT